MNVAKTLIRLYTERDRLKASVDASSRHTTRLSQENKEFRKCLEEVWLLRQPESQSVMNQHLGSNFGINIEMREVYSPRLKEQLEVQWPIVVNRSTLTGTNSSKTTKSDGVSPEQ